MPSLKTLFKLGLGNVAKVAVYRLSVGIGLHPVCFLAAETPAGNFYRPPPSRTDVPPANRSWDHHIWRFGWHSTSHTGEPPSWFANPFASQPLQEPCKQWWKIPDFGDGDIKGIWELSRFNWVSVWSTVAANGDEAALGRLNNWLNSWSSHNPPYRGPNWKCGQEASIRVLHLVIAAWVLGQDHSPEPSLVSLLVVHLQRVRPTISYAIAQRNNHAILEATALFIGGTMLSPYHPSGEKWARIGRRLLERLAVTLIQQDGSFSQYSTNYHRFMLDSYSLAEAWRRHRRQRPFTGQLFSRLALATDWLETLCDRESGDVPNIGANDGADLIQVTERDFRDFRHSIQLAAALFGKRDAFGSGPWNTTLKWLNISGNEVRKPPSIPRPLSPEHRTFQDGGYHVLRLGAQFAVLRFPRFRFRPGHADALHIDFWRNGINILRDAGTYSYNSSDSMWFSGTSAHNTIEFDRRDQMPRGGRFLFTNWLETLNSESATLRHDLLTAAASYTDNDGATHRRTVALSVNCLSCKDEVSGSFRRARLRWRLAPGSWRLVDGLLLGFGVTISVEIDGQKVIPEISTTAESRYYLHQREITEISVEVVRPATLITRVTY